MPSISAVSFYPSIFPVFALSYYLSSIPLTGMITVFRSYCPCRENRKGAQDRRRT
jgi:hypothetical protein